MTQLSREAQNLNWLVSNFARAFRGGARDRGLGRRAPHGRLRAARPSQSRPARRRRLRLASLTQGAARCFDAGAVMETIVEMEKGFLFVMSVRWLLPGRASLAIL